MNGMKTFIGIGIATLGLVVGPEFFGPEEQSILSGDMETLVTKAVGVYGLLMGLYGRWKANRKLGSGGGELE